MELNLENEYGPLRKRIGRNSKRLLDDLREKETVEYIKSQKMDRRKGVFSSQGKRLPKAWG